MVQLFALPRRAQLIMSMGHRDGSKLSKRTSSRPFAVNVATRSRSPRPATCNSHVSTAAWPSLAPLKCRWAQLPSERLPVDVPVLFVKRSFSARDSRLCTRLSLVCCYSSTLFRPGSLVRELPCQKPGFGDSGKSRTLTVPRCEAPRRPDGLTSWRCCGRWTEKHVHVS